MTGRAARSTKSDGPGRAGKVLRRGGPSTKEDGPGRKKTGPCTSLVRTCARKDRTAPFEAPTLPQTHSACFTRFASDYIQLTPIAKEQSWSLQPMKMAELAGVLRKCRVGKSRKKFGTRTWKVSGPGSGPEKFRDRDFRDSQLRDQKFS